MPICPAESSAGPVTSRAAPNVPVGPVLATWTCAEVGEARVVNATMAEPSPAIPASTSGEDVPSAAACSGCCGPKLPPAGR